MDRNQITGFSLLAILVVIYLLYNQHEQKTYLESKRITDSTARARNPRPIVDSSYKTVGNQPVVVDSITEALRKLQPASYYGIADTNIVLENKKLSLKFSTKGAYPTAAYIKNYKTYRDFNSDKSTENTLCLFKGSANRLSALLPIDNSKSTADLYFVPTKRTEPNGDETIDFSADLAGGRKVDIIYTLPANDFMMRCNIVLTGLNGTVLPVSWQTSLLTTEKDITNERLNTQIYYKFKDEDQDYFTVKAEEQSKQKNDPVLWYGFRKQYFSMAMVADDGLNKMDARFGYKADDSNVVAKNDMMFQMNLKPGKEQVVSLRWFIGPNDYNTLNSYKIGMESMVPLGFGMFAFVKYVNRFALIPFFYFLSSFITNYALIIVLMTVVIRLILSFFTYKSYLSSAKMRVLKPELDEIKAKCGDDTQKFSMEQMKLYKAAGVNPLGGCLPMLIQLPILLSMYYMFPSFIEFRQKSFLWAKDLSTYDSILDFHFTVPFYGDHISLFTLMMTATSLFLAIYNRNMTPQQNDPNMAMMKYMPYIFPIILMGMFNKMAAALTFYYTFSNLLSILQQFVIQKYFINEKAIHAQLQENKSKPTVQSKWQQKLEEMQKIQQNQKGIPAKNTKK